MSENKQRGRGSLEERAFRENKVERVMLKAKGRKTEEEPGEEALDDGKLVELFRIQTLSWGHWGTFGGLTQGKTWTDLCPLPCHLPCRRHIQPPDCSLNWTWVKTLQGGQWFRTGLLVTGMQAMAAEVEREDELRDPDEAARLQGPQNSRHIAV